LGKRVTACEKPGVAPSIELVAAPTMRSLKMPKPPRIDVFPSPNGSQASPKRGAKFVQLLAHHLPDCCTVSVLD